MADHQMKTLFQRPDRIAEPLYVITPIFNPIRFRTRWKLYEDFQKHVEEAGAILYTVEVAFGDRDFVVTDPENPRHIRLRTRQELWFKENLINIGVQHLTRDVPGWEFVAWLDADTHFVRPDWADETRHLLQHYSFIQMWDEFQDLNNDYGLLHTTPSFMATYLESISKFQEALDSKLFPDCDYPYPYPGPYQKGKPLQPGAPGLNWAARRDAWDHVGGLFDHCILGSGDWWMARALVGQFPKSVKGYHPRYIEHILEWQDRAERHIRRNVGVMKGLVLHYWHGPKAKRGYGTRERVLIQNQFNPDTHLKRDAQGLWCLAEHSPRSIELRDDIREYFRSRDEDSTS